MSIHLSSQALEWAVNYLTINDSPILEQKKIIQTPYSEVYKIDTVLGKTFYLKQVPAALFLEPMMLAYFHEQGCQNTPKFVVKNNTLHCFLMASCGELSLRSLFKERVNLDILNQGITNYTEMQRYSKVVGTCNQALSIIKLPHEIQDVPDAISLNIARGEIRFQEVSFHYENRSNLFKNLTVTLNPGEKVGLVGYSGGGKSTFIKLILRLLDIQQEHIFIDNQDIKTVTQGSLRSQIATIPQEPELFHRTIVDNIRFARSNATEEEVIDAAKKAHCHDFIMDLPQKYESLVGERGVKLSGGQKQRIAIARAFLKNARVGFLF